jgi:hypothetical protein
MMLRAPAVVLVALVAGCAPTSSPCGVTVPVARCAPAQIDRTFSEKYLCPADRMTTRDRADLPLRRFACEGAAATSARCGGRPPDEVARDPERLALWRRIKGEALGTLEDRFTGVFEVSGCGEHRFYTCPLTSWRGVETPHCDPGSILDLGTKEPPADQAVPLE